MELSTPELRELIKNLELHNVKYILIGGFAMAYYGNIRATNDIDLWIKNAPENMDRLRVALMATGYAEANAIRTTTQLVPGFAVFNMLESGFKIDLMHNLKAFKEADFERCYLRASISDYQGFKIPVLAAEDLLKEKENINREKDLNDISFLKKLLLRP